MYTTRAINYNKWYIEKGITNSMLVKSFGHTLSSICAGSVNDPSNPLQHSDIWGRNHELDDSNFFFTHPLFDMHRQCIRLVQSSSKPRARLHKWQQRKWCARSAAVWCSVMCVAVCCSVLQCVAVCRSVSQCVAVCCSVLQCVAVCCSVLQCVALCCGVWQNVACQICLLCVAVWCSVL